MVNEFFFPGWNYRYTYTSLQTKFNVDCTEYNLKISGIKFTYRGIKVDTATFVCVAVGFYSYVYPNFYSV